MKFMLMMNAPRGKASGDWDVANWKPEELKAHIGFMRELNQALTKEGVLVAAEGLGTPGQARIVRAGKGGEPEVTDGPFAESKEFLVGYWIVHVETPQQAYAIAARASAAPGPGGKALDIPIEVREVMSPPPVDP
ncbi:MAG TPA: YciI family protein [Polyangiaceae bacterium]